MGRLEMFNAIKYYRELEAAGFTREQAEAALNMVYNFGEQNLASKDDLKQAVTELKHAIESAEHKMTIKMGSVGVAVVGLVVALVAMN
jgi:hypothetical protein